MTRSRYILGRHGEEEAKKYLQAKGFAIHAQNVRTRLGELDLVAWDGDCLVFVEVKARRGFRFGTALESVDVKKRTRMIGAAKWYIAQEHLSGHLIRFDVIGITWEPGKTNPTIQHIVNAFHL